MVKIYKLNNDSVFSHVIVKEENEPTLGVLFFDRDSVINFHEKNLKFISSTRYFEETTIETNYLKRQGAIEIDPNKFFMKLKLLSIYAYDDIKNKYNEYTK